MIKIQIVLYENDPNAIRRLRRALSLAVRRFGRPIAVHLGDCSAQPLIDGDALEAWRREFHLGVRAHVDYMYFGENLGFGRGHNRLWHESPGVTRLLILNPDALPAPHLLVRLSQIADDCAEWGGVEARQIPIEHPKRFDPNTLETAWVSGACALIDGAGFDAVRGFDDAIFMYGEDVDLSWRLRALGRRLYFCPQTFVYHAKRLADRQPILSAAERIYGPLASMLLRAKYGREDLNVHMLDLLRTDPRPECGRTLAEYTRLRQHLGPVTAHEQAMASFAPDGGLADMRWTYPLPGTMIVASSAPVAQGANDRDG